MTDDRQPATGEEQTVWMWRLDHQDDVLKEILAEVKRTNGRVTQLELAQAIVKDREKQIEDRTDSGRQRFQMWIGVIGVCVGGAVGELLHLVGA